jgi:uncharacterized protein
MIVADTGPLVALGDTRSKLHQPCVELLRSTERPWLIPAPVVTEVCQLLASRVHADAEAAFLRSLTGKTFRVVNLEAEDYERAAELVAKYADLPLGGVDASVVAVAERLDIPDIATIDIRHFSVVRPQHIDAFTLLPTGRHA